jgi:hypothetical protein
MRRLFATFALAAAAALALAGPALAWDSVRISITPPAGGSPTASGTGGDVIDMLLISRPMDARPADHLGPSFRISYTFPAAAGESGVIVQDLYPYAPGGPVAYSAANASIVGHPILAGWHQGDAALLQRFVSWGLPTAPVEAATTSSGASVASAWTAVTERTRAVVLAGLALALAALGVGVRQRRQVAGRTPA